MKKIILGIIAVSLLVATGCATTTVCTTIPTGESYLCKVADSLDVKLEDVGTGLIIANSLAIGQGAYTVEEAVETLKSLRAFINQPVDYTMVRDKIHDILSEYPGLFVVSMVYLNQLNSVELIGTTDRDILNGWLTRQIDILGG